MNSSSPKETTHFSHKVAIGLWHFVCTFVTLGVLAILCGSLVDFGFTLLVISLTVRYVFTTRFLQRR